MVSGYAVDSSTGFQPVEDEIKELRELATQAYEDVESYDDMRGEPLHTAYREDVMDFAHDLYRVYEDLLGVEMDDETRDLFDDSISYDWSFTERVEKIGESIEQGLFRGLITGSAVGSAMSLAGPVSFMMPCLVAASLTTGFTAIKEYIDTKQFAVGRFDPSSFDILVSPDRTVKDDAYRSTIAEVFHGFQVYYGSPTWPRKGDGGFEDNLLWEGMEQAMAVTVPELLGEGGLYDGKTADVLSTSLANAYASVRNEVDDIDRAVSYADIGFDTEEIIRQMKQDDRHAGGGKPSHVYTVGAAALWQAEEREGLRVYEDVFKGDLTSLPTWFHEYQRRMRERGETDD